jgi:hypothetical protein
MSFVFALSIVASVTACGAANDVAKSQPPPPPKETVFDDLIATKERAKQQTEQALRQDKENMDAALKDAEGPPSAPKPND